MGFIRVNIYDSKINTGKNKLAKYYKFNLIDKIVENGYNIIIDTVGDQFLFNVALKSLKMMGHYLLPSTYISEELIFPVSYIAKRELKIMGLFEPSWEIGRVLKFIKNLDLSIIEDEEIYTIDNFREAIERLESDELANVVIKP